jgi:putative transposase
VVCKYGIKDFSIKDIQKEFGYSHIPNRVIQSVVTYYCQSLELFYKGKHTHPPKFHKYDENKRSFCAYHVDWEIKKDSIPLPHTKYNNIKSPMRIKFNMDKISKIGIKIIKNIKFYEKNGKWYVSGSCETNDTIPEKIKGREIIGIDWGIKTFLTTSDRRFINYPLSVDREFYRIKRIKKKLNSKIPNSNNYNKLNFKLSKAYYRYSNLKDDFIKQTVLCLLKNNDVAIEDIDDYSIYKHKNMKNHVITSLRNTHPFAKFVKFLDWCSIKNGYNVYKVQPYNTSRKCSNCGKIKENLTLDDRVFECSCGYSENRDVNAAINIKNKAIELL